MLAAIIIGGDLVAVLSDSVRPYELEPTRFLPLGFPRQELEWVAISISRDLPDPGLNPCLLHWQAGSLLTEPPEKQKRAFTVFSRSIL